MMVFLLLFATLLGCSQETIQSASRDAERNVEAVQREGQRAERKVRPQVQKLNLGARVTVALRANERLPKTIRVDADTNGVKLRGSVRTAEEKELAERIARDTLGPERAVVNDLKVTGS